MKAQIPAEGISKMNEWPDAKYYKVPCSCGCDNDVTMMIEVDECSISTTFCSTTKTNYWRERLHINYGESWLILNAKLLFNDWYNRFAIIWMVLVQGYIQTESCVILSPQQSLNFAETLKTAIKDFENQVQKQKEDLKKDKI